MKNDGLMVQKAGYLGLLWRKCLSYKLVKGSLIGVTKPTTSSLVHSTKWKCKVKRHNSFLGHLAIILKWDSNILMYQLAYENAASGSAFLKNHAPSQFSFSNVV